MYVSVMVIFFSDLTFESKVLSCPWTSGTEVSVT